MKTKQRVLVIGGISWDIIASMGRLPGPNPQTTFAKEIHETLGSTGAGKALSLAKLGLDVTLHGLLGEDEYGAKVRQCLSSAPLRFVYDVDPAGTERHVNLMADDGSRISIYLTHSSFEPTLDRSRLQCLIEEADIVVLNIINYCRTLIPTIRAANKPIWCDLHDWDGENDYHRDFIDAADVLFFSTEAMADPKAFMTAQIDAGKQLVVGTMGKNGSLCCRADGTWIETPAAPVKALVDTNGAGDAFFSGFLHGRLSGLETARCMELGARVAAACVQSTELVHPDLNPEAFSI